MPKTAFRKEKWTLSFDRTLKGMVVRAARRKGLHPVTLLEDLVREKFNPFGYAGVKDSTAYVTALRRKGRKQSDEAFLAELKAWHKPHSS